MAHPPPEICQHSVWSAAPPLSPRLAGLELGGRANVSSPTAEESPYRRNAAIGSPRVSWLSTVALHKPDFGGCEQVASAESATHTSGILNKCLKQNSKKHDLTRPQFLSLSSHFTYGLLSLHLLSPLFPEPHLSNLSCFPGIPAPQRTYLCSDPSPSPQSPTFFRSTTLSSISLIFLSCFFFICPFPLSPFHPQFLSFPFLSFLFLHFSRFLRFLFPIFLFFLVFFLLP